MTFCPTSLTSLTSGFFIFYSFFVLCTFCSHYNVDCPKVFILLFDNLSKTFFLLPNLKRVSLLFKVGSISPSSSTCLNFPFFLWIYIVVFLLPWDFFSYITFVGLSFKCNRYFLIPKSGSRLQNFYLRSSVTWFFFISVYFNYIENYLSGLYSVINSVFLVCLWLKRLILWKWFPLRFSTRSHLPTRGSTFWTQRSSLPLMHSSVYTLIYIYLWLICCTSKVT